MSLDLEAIAKAAGVSRSTVSRVLNNRPDVKESTRQKILQIIEENNYRPNSLARALATQKTRILSLVIPQPIPDIFSEPYNPIMIQSISLEAVRHGYAVMIWMGSTMDEEISLSDQILENGHFDGLIVISSVEKDPIIERLAQDHFPFLLIGPPPMENLNYINSENTDGAKTAVKHLISLGWERIGMITGPHSLRVSLDRMNGYYHALEEAGRPIISKLMVEGGYGEPAGYESMMRLLDDDVDAVFVSSDIMALGAMRAIQERGLQVGLDVGVVGFDDMPIAATARPPLTTIRQPIQEVGVLATQVLIDLLEEKLEAPYQRIVPTELIIRESCGAAWKGDRTP